MKSQTSIIIVEDNLCIASSMEVMLSRWGYNVQGIFSTAEDAWQEVLYSPPDLLLINMHLEGNMNGIEMIFRLRMRFHFPIVLVSGVLLNQLPSLPEEVNILPKPFLPFQLKQMVREVCV